LVKAGDVFNFEKTVVRFCQLNKKLGKGEGMRDITKFRGINLIGLILMLCCATTIASAQMTVNRENRKDFESARKITHDADKVLREVMQVPDKAIPRELLERAHGIGVFPNVKKAAFIVGGRGGSGLVARRAGDGWSTPVFYNMGGTSFGAQIGASSTDYVLLFMNEGALQELLDDKIEFSGSVSFAAGPVGRTAGAGTNLTLDAGILTWSRSKGAFIGASLNGAAITANNSLNTSVYGKRGGEVLENPGTINAANSPAEFRMFTQRVAGYAKTGQ
jgi:SH3 domain-containing YSC84-like protein 1